MSASVVKENISGRSIAPLSGWALNTIANLDIQRPGFAGHFLRSSAERRQVVSAYLSCRFEHELDVSVADFLIRSRHRTILDCAFGSVPEGFRVALSKAGAQPHEQDFYLRLHRALADPTCTRFRKAIGQLDEVTPSRVKIGLRLPEQLRSSRLITALHDDNEAYSLTRLLPLLIARGADECALHRSLREIASDGLDKLLLRWSLKLRLAEGAIPESDLFRPVRSGRELQSLALRYRNCARTYIADALSGTACFGVFHHENTSVVVHIVKPDGFWVLDGLYGFHNRSVPDHVSRAATDFLRRYGVDWRQTRKAENGDWKLLRRAVRFAGMGL